MRRFSHWVVRRRRLILAVAVVLLIPAVIGMAATYVNYDILSYLPQELDSMVAQRYLEEDFSMASTAMITVEGLPTADLMEMKAEIEGIEGVDRVIWQDDLLDVRFPADMLPQQIRDIYFRDDATLMLVTFTGTSASAETMNAISRIEGVLRQGCFIGGLSAILQDTKALADREIGGYVILAAVLSLTVLLLGVKSTLAPFLFLVGIAFPILYNMGSNVLLGQVSYITKSLAAVLQLGVTMDFSIFLYHRFDEGLEQGLSPDEAMAQAISRTFSSIAGSSLTTIAGFLAMCTMQLALGVDIGLVMAKGVVLGVVSTVTILPAMLLTFQGAVTRHTHPVLIPRMNRSAGFVVRHRGLFFALFLLILVPFTLAEKQTSVYYTMTDALPADMTAIVGTNRMKDQFNMATTHFVFVDDSLDNRQMAGLIKEIGQVQGVENTISLEQFWGERIPDDFIPQHIKDMVRSGGMKMFMVNSRYGPATEALTEQMEEMRSIISRYDPNGKIGGEGALTGDLVAVCDRDFASVNTASIALVFVIIALVFRSFSIPVLLVAAIEGAILINMGVPYFSGTVIPFVASIVIGTIQLGATVDYSILMTTRYREERNRGLHRVEAARAALMACSQSILTSGLTFFGATFGVALISKIELISGLCLMIARGAIISMAVILLVLPSILVLFDRLMEKTTWQFIQVQDTPSQEGNQKEVLL